MQNESSPRFQRRLILVVDDQSHRTLCSPTEVISTYMSPDIEAFCPPPPRIEVEPDEPDVPEGPARTRLLGFSYIGVGLFCFVAMAWLVGVLSLLIGCYFIWRDPSRRA